MDGMNTYDISVLVLTYNPEWEELQSTLNSIIGQKGCNFEIVVSDDGSEKNISDQLEEFFQMKSFRNYTLIRNKDNRGTVKNLRDALNYCKAEYVKDIGQGDILYNENTLSVMHEFLCKGNYEFVCGNAVPMLKEPGCIKIFSHCTIQCTTGNSDKTLGTECFVKTEYPHGAAFFYKKNTYIKYLDEIINKVVYCDDLAARLMILDGQRLAYLSKYVVFYECESGISNTTNGTRRVSKDLANFEEYILERPETSPARNIGHIRKIISLRHKKKQSPEKSKRISAAILLLFSDIRIPFNWLENRFHKKRLQNIDIRCAEKWTGVKCIIE